ncbi:MAG: hypothetical protein QXL69_03915 [Candidatus Bathyarchaeia archaeon]|nr:hypothetical protein [Candidatus Bathyarchaeota archaeon]
MKYLFARKLYLSIIIIDAIFSILFFLLLRLNMCLVELFTDYAVPVSAFLPVITGFSLIKKYNSFNSLFGKCFSFLTTGLTLWFLGEVLWPIYTRILNIEMPSPSLMDFLWMSGYIFIGVGVYWIFTIFKPKLILKRTTLLLIVFLTLIAVLTIIYLTPIIYKGSLVLEQFIYGYYLVMDISILSFLTIVHRVFKGGEISKPWLILIAGLTVTFLADIFFNLATSINSKLYLSIGDLIYINGYSLIGLGLTKHLIEF